MIGTANIVIIAVLRFVIDTTNLCNFENIFHILYVEFHNYHKDCVLP